MPALLDKTYVRTSVLTRLDVRTKTAVVAVAAVSALVASSVAAQLVLFACTLVYVLLLGRYRMLAVAFGAMMLMMAAATCFAWLIGRWQPGLGGLRADMLLVPFLRGFSMINTVLALALTTRVEDLLSSLERAKLPFCFYLPVAVMLRFIPTFTEDVRQVWETLRIKGWPMGACFFARHPLLASRLVLAPLLFRALKSSETLGIAAELKGVGSRERTLVAGRHPFTRLDASMIAWVVAAAVGVAATEVYLGTLWMSGARVMH